MLKSTYHYFHDLLHRPLRVFWICVALATMGLLLDGTAFRLWSLKRDHRVLHDKIREGQLRAQQLQFRIQKAQELGFIERAARDQFDLVKEGDLIFIFSDDAAEAERPTSASDSGSLTGGVIEKSLGSFF